METYKFPDSISKIAIYNASHVTTELPGALLIALRSVHPMPDCINIVSSLVYDDKSTLYIIICGAGLGSDNYVTVPIYYIVYQLDPLPIFNKETYRKLLTDAIYNWDYSRKSLAYCEKLNYNIKLHYLPPGYTESLSLPEILDGSYLYSDKDKDIDVLFLGWDIWTRRALIRDELYKSGLNIWFVCNLNIEQMKLAIKRSKICINIHHDETLEVFQSIRMNILLSNQSFIISEEINDDETSIYKDNILFVPYDKLVETCVNFIKEPDLRRDQAIKSYQWYKNERYWNKIVDFNSLLPLNLKNY